MVYCFFSSYRYNVYALVNLIQFVFVADVGTGVLLIFLVMRNLTAGIIVMPAKNQRKLRKICLTYRQGPLDPWIPTDEGAGLCTMFRWMVLMICMVAVEEGPKSKAALKLVLTLIYTICFLLALKELIDIKDLIKLFLSPIWKGIYWKRKQLGHKTLTLTDKRRLWWVI